MSKENMRQAIISDGYEAWYRQRFNTESAILDGDQVVLHIHVKTSLEDAVAVQAAMWAEIPVRFLRYVQGGNMSVGDRVITNRNFFYTVKKRRKTRVELRPRKIGTVTAKRGVRIDIELESGETLTDKAVFWGCLSPLDPSG